MVADVEDCQYGEEVGFAVVAGGLRYGEGGPRTMLVTFERPNEEACEVRRRFDELIESAYRM